MTLVTDIRSSSRHEAVTLDANLVNIDGLPKYRALYIEIGGDVSITDINGTTVIYTVPDGTLLPFSAKVVNTSGTTATGITGWF